MSEHHLSDYDMTVTGANSASIKVLGTMLVEFSSRESGETSKQIVMFVMVYLGLC